MEDQENDVDWELEYRQLHKAIHLYADLKGQDGLSVKDYIDAQTLYCLLNCNHFDVDLVQWKDEIEAFAEQLQTQSNVASINEWLKMFYETVQRPRMMKELKGALTEHLSDLLLNQPQGSKEGQ